MPWIATGPGKAFRPLRFAADGWTELMRLEPAAWWGCAATPVSFTLSICQVA